MERQSMKRKKKKELINYLPKAASPVIFRSPTLSPIRRANLAAARFSRSRVSIIPDEVRRRPTKTSSRGSTHEPTSPKVSCIGTIKLRNDRKKKKKKTSEKMIELIIEFSNFRLFGSKAGEIGNAKSDGRGDPEEGAGECSAPLNKGLVPSLGQIRRFASGRRWSADFDWAAQVAPVNDSDEKTESGEKEEDEEMMELSAERKREIDLWRRRKLNLRLPLQTALQSK